MTRCLGRGATADGSSQSREDHLAAPRRLNQRPAIDPHFVRRAKREPDASALPLISLAKLHKLGKLRSVCWEFQQYRGFRL
ncbi:MAG: hypothetical protein IAG10_05145 [Planctomycetaceae bacterium]|nr:hypothetical protein [Planctomycetaceae bacterium]